MFNSISVIGGDLRQLALADQLMHDGYNVFTYGFDKDVPYEYTPIGLDQEHVLKNDIIILPVPATYDSITIHSQYTDCPMTIDALLTGVKQDAMVFGGKIPELMKKKLGERGISCYDYLLREEFAVKNAVPTAEGAIEIAISETPFTVHASKCLVTGYGRIGKILSKMLSGIGADTYVAARKYCDLAMIEGNGLIPIHFRELSDYIADFDIIFNTVPKRVFNYDILMKLKKNALLIDLASKPGGVDMAAAKDAGVKVIWALSLPGKIAPVTSGEIIKDTILNIIREEKGGGKLGIKG